MFPVSLLYRPADAQPFVLYSDKGWDDGVGDDRAIQTEVCHDGVLQHHAGMTPVCGTRCPCDGGSAGKTFTRSYTLEIAPGGRDDEGVWREGVGT